MMLRSAFLALVIAGCAAAPAQQPQHSTTGCDLKVEFASIGTGIDRAVLEKVDALLSGDKGVSTIGREPWGREGEITLCVATVSEADAARLFGQVKALFPAMTEKPLRVETRAGQSYYAPTALP